MDKQTAQALVRRALGSKWRIESIDPRKVVVAFSAEKMYDEATFGIKDLLELSRLFRTDKINVRYEDGWGGTDITPGDPARITLEIYAE